MTLLFNNLVLKSYLSGIYLESWSSWLLGGVRKTLWKRRKQTEEKHWKVKRKKNEEYEESQITTVYIFGFKLYSAPKHSLKKSCLHLYTIKFYLQFLCVAGYLKDTNDTARLNIQKYTNYNIIEIYMNRISIRTLIFIVMDYSLMMSEEKYFHFRKRQKHLAETFFSHPVEITGSLYFGNIFWIMCSSNFSKICTKTWKKLE